MPTYVYRCKSCLKEFEELQRFADAPLVKCPSCKKKKLVRVIGRSGLVFKGSGFYLTDYKNTSTPPESESVPATKKETKGEVTSETKTEMETKSDSKTESKNETKSSEISSSKKKSKPSSAKEK
jgi:putative FmdB family regulatory protein